MTTEKLTEAVEALESNEASKFTGTIDEVLREKALALIEARKIELASSWLNEQDDNDDDDEEEDDDEKSKSKKKKNDDDDEDDEQEEGYKKRKK